jgi:hypothetical protein
MRVDVLRGWLILQAVLAAGPVVAAAAEAQPAQPDRQLDEVLVEGTRLKSERNAQKIIDWMARLVGSFTFEGHVDLHGKGNAADLRQVQGAGNCTGFGPAPAVQCEIKVRWPEARGERGEAIPGGVSQFDPAMILYGFEPNRLGIRYMLVGSKGVANGDLALLVGDTLVSRTPCVDFPGNCQRVMRVTAAPDLELVEMRIELAVDQRKALEYAFVMRRVPGSASVVHSGASDQ